MTSKIDIIIPVYNNVKLTIACIRSIYKHLKNNINQVIIHDDCSSIETNKTLVNHKNAYPHSLSNLTIIRSEPNIGFAAGVNKAAKLASSNSNYLLILNSDTEILGNFLSPMLKILDTQTTLAALNPSGPVFSDKKLARCSKIKIDNKLSYINSANISGYALLIKKDIFNDIGGFNTVYGRGYYEDTELSRVLINNGYDLGIYQTDKISHVGQSSFNSLEPKEKKSKNFANELIEKNKQLYLSRNPKADQYLDIYTFKSDFNNLPEQTQKLIQYMVLAGGTVTIYGTKSPENLPYFQIKYKKLNFAKLMKLILLKTKLVKNNQKNYRTEFV